MSGEQIKPGYKRTEVGVIPEDWNVTSLGDVGDCFIGLTYSPKNVSNHGILVLRSSNIQDGVLAFEDNVYVDIEVPEKIVVQNGDILICVRNGSRRLIGKCALLDHRVVGQTFGAFMSVFRTKDSAYIFQQFQSDLIKKQIDENIGATINQITNANLNSFKIPFPPTPSERCSIATTLSDVDALLAKLDQLIAKKRDLKQAAMQQLLTGQIRLPGFSGEWEVKRLGDVGNCLRGVTYKGDSDLSPYDTAETKRLLRSNNVQDSTVVIEDLQFVNSNRVSPMQLLRPDDILICMANGSKALVGKAGFFNVNDGYEYTFGAFMGCFRTDKVSSHPNFIFYLFQTARYKDYINNLLAGSSINNLSPSSIESLSFLIPSLAEQAVISQILSDADAELAILEVRRKKTLALKQGMMEELLTGKIRLSYYDASGGVTS